MTHCHSICTCSALTRKLQFYAIYVSNIMHWFKKKWYHLSTVDPDLMVCRLLNVIILTCVRVPHLSYQHKLQQAKSWSQMMFVWGWQMHRLYGLWIAASIDFKLMCIKIATVCTIEKLHCISIKICIWYCTSRFGKKMSCIVRHISLNNLFNKTTFSYIYCFVGLSGLVF